MGKRPIRTAALVILGFLAFRSINIRGFEEASNRGAIGEMVGHTVAPMIFVLMMLGIIFWPKKKKGE